MIVQGLCIVADNILDECYLVADVLSKAIFGLTMWHTKTKILKVRRANLARRDKLARILLFAMLLSIPR